MNLGGCLLYVETHSLKLGILLLFDWASSGFLQLTVATSFIKPQKNSDGTSLLSLLLNNHLQWGCYASVPQIRIPNEFPQVSESGGEKGGFFHPRERELLWEWNIDIDKRAMVWNAVNGGNLVPLIGGIGDIYKSPSGSIYHLYTTYILPIGWLYITYHPLREPETAVETRGSPRMEVFPQKNSAGSPSPKLPIVWKAPPWNSHFRTWKLMVGRWLSF